MSSSSFAKGSTRGASPGPSIGRVSTHSRSAGRKVELHAQKREPLKPPTTVKIQKQSAQPIQDIAIPDEAVNGGIMAAGAAMLHAVVKGIKPPVAVKGVPAAAAVAALTNAPQAVLVDIRSKFEQKESGIPDIRVSRKRVYSIPFVMGSKTGSGTVVLEVDGTFLTKLSKCPGLQQDSVLILLDSDGDLALKAARQIVGSKLYSKVYYVLGGADGPQGWKASGVEWRDPASLTFTFPIKMGINKGLAAVITNYNKNPSLINLALTLAATGGVALFVIKEFETILEVVGVYAAASFLARILLVEEDRDKTFKLLRKLLLDRLVSGKGSPEFKKLARLVVTAGSADSAVKRLEEQLKHDTAVQDAEDAKAAMASAAAAAAAEPTTTETAPDSSAAELPTISARDLEVARLQQALQYQVDLSLRSLPQQLLAQQDPDTAPPPAVNTSTQEPLPVTGITGIEGTVTLQSAEVAEAPTADVLQDAISQIDLIDYARLKQALEWHVKRAQTLSPTKLQTSTAPGVPSSDVEPQDAAPVAQVSDSAGDATTDPQTELNSEEDELEAEFEAQMALLALDTLSEAEMKQVLMDKLQAALQSAAGVEGDAGRWVWIVRIAQALELQLPLSQQPAAVDVTATTPVAAESDEVVPNSTTVIEQPSPEEDVVVAAAAAAAVGEVGSDSDIPAMEEREATLLEEEVAKLPLVCDATAVGEAEADSDVTAMEESASQEVDARVVVESSAADVSESAVIEMDVNAAPVAELPAADVSESAVIVLEINAAPVAESPAVEKQAAAALESDVAMDAVRTQAALQMQLTRSSGMQDLDFFMDRVKAAADTPEVVPAVEDSGSETPVGDIAAVAEPVQVVADDVASVAAPVQAVADDAVAVADSVQVVADDVAAVAAPVQVVASDAAAVAEPASTQVSNPATRQPVINPAAMAQAIMWQLMKSLKRDTTPSKRDTTPSGNDTATQKEFAAIAVSDSKDGENALAVEEVQQGPGNVTESTTNAAVVETPVMAYAETSDQPSSEEVTISRQAVDPLDAERTATALQRQLSQVQQQLDQVQAADSSPDAAMDPMERVRVLAALEYQLKQVQDALALDPETLASSSRQQAQDPLAPEQTATALQRQLAQVQQQLVATQAAVDPLTEAQTVAALQRQLAQVQQQEAQVGVASSIDASSGVVSQLAADPLDQDTLVAALDRQLAHVQQQLLQEDVAGGNGAAGVELMKEDVVMAALKRQLQQSEELQAAAAAAAELAASRVEDDAAVLDEELDARFESLSRQFSDAISKLSNAVDTVESTQDANPSSIPSASTETGSQGTGERPAKPPTPFWNAERQSQAVRATYTTMYNVATVMEALRHGFVMPAGGNSGAPAADQQLQFDERKKRMAALMADVDAAASLLKDDVLDTASVALPGMAIADANIAQLSDEINAVTSFLNERDAVHEDGPEVNAQSLELQKSRVANLAAEVDAVAARILADDDLNGAEGLLEREPKVLDSNENVGLEHE